MPDASKKYETVIEVDIETFVDWWHEAMEQAVQETGARGMYPAYSCMMSGLLNPPFEGNA